MTNLEVEPNPDLTDVEGDLQEEMGITNIMSEIRKEQIREEILAPIREALSNHPRCDVHPEDDPVSCGWKRAVLDVQNVLDRLEESKLNG